MTRKVILPRRLKADCADGLIATVLLLAPIYVVPAMAGYLPPALHKLSIIGIPAGALYVLFRDAIGKGASFGKRWLGLRIIDLNTGAPCAAGRVWSRNLTDLIPLLDCIDFVLMCVDPRGQKMMDKILKIQVTETS